MLRIISKSFRYGLSGGFVFLLLMNSAHAGSSQGLLYYLVAFFLVLAVIGLPVAIFSVIYFDNLFEKDWKSYRQPDSLTHAYRIAFAIGALPVVLAFPLMEYLNPFLACVVFLFWQVLAGPLALLLSDKSIPQSFWMGVVIALGVPMVVSPFIAGNLLPPLALGLFLAWQVLALLRSFYRSRKGLTRDKREERDSSLSASSPVNDKNIN